MRATAAVAVSMLVSLAVFAQGPPNTLPAKAAFQKQQSSITLAVSSLPCNTPVGSGAFHVLSWSWGASNPITLGSSGGVVAGRPSVSGLVITKRFDECSPSLFQAVATGKLFKTVTLTQQDSNGNVVTTVTLTNAIVSSWQVAGAVNQELPSESASFDFEKVCVSDTASGTTVCYDSAVGKVL